MRHFVLCFILSAFCFVQASTIHLNLINDNNQTIIQRTVHIQTTEKQVKQSLSHQFKSVSFSPKKVVAMAAVLVGASYGGLLAHLSYRARNACNDQGWGCWKHEVPLAVLKELAREEIMQELCADIGKKYADQSALLCFMQDLHKELIQLRQFLAFHALMERWNLDAIMPKQQKERALAQVKIDRLLFFQSLIIDKRLAITG